jgi:hypothetical protein
VRNAALIVTIALLPFLLPGLAGAFCFEEAGSVYGVNPHLLQSIARVESDLNPAAINRNRNGSVDLGLMQINSFWLKSLGATSQELIDKPCYNVMVGAWILSDCLNRHGKTWKAIGCYNATGHDKRVNYSWKIYRELQKETKDGTRNKRSESLAAHIMPLPAPPLQSVTAQTGQEHYDTTQATAVPAVSSIYVSVTEKD